MIKPYLMGTVFCSLTLLTGLARAASPCPPGFAQLQASDTCVRISGRVQADAIAGSSRFRSSDRLQTETSGRVQLDVRKQTEYGPLRAVIRVDGVRR
jgi:porin-like protein